MSRTIVIGDIHGAFEALQQVIERSGFDVEVDRLICLGDIADRRANVKECVDMLLQVKDLILILGNHDLWALEWMEKRYKKQSNKSAKDHVGREIIDVPFTELSEVWKYQGGEETIESYGDAIPTEHISLFRKAKYYHIEKNRLYVHGGINHHNPLEQQDKSEFLWDRSLIQAAISAKDQSTMLTDFDEVFVGHTPTITIPVRELPEEAFKLSSAHRMNGDDDQIKIADQKRQKGWAFRSRMTDWPIRFCNVWMMDTGAGWSGGKLSMMDVETKEFWQSDPLD